MYNFFKFLSYQGSNKLYQFNCTNTYQLHCTRTMTYQFKNCTKIICTKPSQKYGLLTSLTVTYTKIGAGALKNDISFSNN